MSEKTAPACGGALRRIGEEGTETLDYVPGRFKVVRHIREKLSCRACVTIVAAPAPDHAIARGRAGACLLAHQAEIFAPRGRHPGNLHLIRLGLARLLRRWAPLVDALAAEVVASDILHVDDTLVPALAPGTGRPRPADYGLTSATSGPLRVSAHWRRCSSTRRIAKTSIRRPT
jgi:transposase